MMKLIKNTQINIMGGNNMPNASLTSNTDNYTSKLSITTSEFLNLIAPDGKLTFQTFDDTPIKRAHLNHIVHGKFVDHKQLLERLNDDGAGIFFMVNQGDLAGRKTENIVRVRAVFIDIDKNGAKTLETVSNWDSKPHLIVESSPGKYHAYWICEDVELAEFSQLQTILANKFGTDKGVTDLPRVMRLPGFHHRKSDDVFMSRVIEMHKELPRYSPQQLREAIDVDKEPIKKEQATDLEVVLAEQPKDFTDEEIDEALAVVNADDYHTWMQVGRALSHQYQHSQEGFKKWDEWSKKSNKYDVDTVKDKWKQCHTRTGGRLTTFATVKAMANEVQAVDMPDWLRDYVFINGVGNGGFYNVKTKRLISTTAFDMTHNKHVEIEAKSRKPRASKVASEYYKIPCVADRMYWPGAQNIFEYEGEEYVNSYSMPNVTIPKTLSPEQYKVIGRYLDHIDKLIPKPEEKQMVLDWMAYVYQNPGKKIQWALVIQGAEGGGKTQITRALSSILGRNARPVNTDDILSKFNSWVDGRCLGVVEEVLVSGVDKWRALDKLKGIITNKEVSIERKGIDSKPVPNFINLIMLTNHKDAIPLHNTDRRYAIVFTGPQTEQDVITTFGDKSGSTRKYFKELNNDIDNNIEAFSHFFKNYDISSGFNPNGHAPSTSAKLLMSEYGRPAADIALIETIDLLKCGVINRDLLNVTALNRLEKTLHPMHRNSDYPRHTNMSKTLLDWKMCHIDTAGGRLKVDGISNVFWTTDPKKYTPGVVRKLMEKGIPEFEVFTDPYSRG